MTWIAVIVAFFALLTALSYFSAPVWLWAVASVIALVVINAHWILLLIVLAICAVVGVPALRKKIISGFALEKVKKIIPPLSSTEQAAIDAGTVWWDAEI